MLLLSPVDVQGFNIAVLKEWPKIWPKINKNGLNTFMWYPIGLYKLVLFAMLFILSPVECKGV